MKSSIEIYHSDKHTWLRELIQKHFSQILDAVEEKVKADKIGLPWREEQRPELSEPSWELDDNIEVASAFENDKEEVGGECWMLADFWFMEAPPGEE